MSNKLIAGLLLFTSIVFASVSLAQERTLQVPLSLQENCLLNNSKLIDECPEYREDIRDINIELEDKRQTAFVSGFDLLQQELENNIKDFKDPYAESQEITNEDIFFNDYKLYLARKFQEFLNNNKKIKNPIVRFFEDTYFDQDQDGLALVGFSFYNNRIPSQYDPTIDLLISLRNFSAQTIDTIQGVYCFSTTKGRDYMYPLDIQPQVDAHSINNLVVTIDIETSPLLEQIEPKGLACTLAYIENDNTYYTDRGTLIFDPKK